MRPIDADQIRGALEAELWRENDDLEDRQWAYGYAAGVYFAIRKLAETPTLTPPNEPLTLEQLREMDGEPVYIIASDMGIAEWNVIAGKVWITVAYDVQHNGFKTLVEGIRFINGRAFRFDSYGTSWFACRRPPEGEEDT